MLFSAVLDAVWRLWLNGSNLNVGSFLECFTYILRDV